MWSEYPAHLEYPVLLMGCGAPGSGSATYTQRRFQSIHISAIHCGRHSSCTDQFWPRRNSSQPACPYWRCRSSLIRWPYLLASVLALLGIAWTWQLSSTYNDAGCVVYVRAWPVDESMIWPVVS